VSGGGGFFFLTPHSIKKKNPPPTGCLLERVGPIGFFLKCLNPQKGNLT
jgi:hypothetical protein